MSKIFGSSKIITNSRKLFKFSNNLCQRLIKKWLARKHQLTLCKSDDKKAKIITQNEIRDLKTQLQPNPVFIDSICTLRSLKRPLSNIIITRCYSLCDEERPKISVIGGPCPETKPMSCKDCKFEDDLDIVRERRKTEGAFNCFREPKPASGKCKPKRTRALGPSIITRKYCTISPNHEIRFRCYGPCARKNEDIQKLRNVTEGCCLREKLPCKKRAKKPIKSKIPSNLIIVPSCTIPVLGPRPIISKLWEERGCIDLRLQTEGPPCKSKCLSTLRMPGCDPRKRVVCDFAPFYYLCKKTPCPHPSFSECKDPPTYKDINECDYCPRTATAPWEPPPRSNSCPTCTIGTCKSSWSVDSCVLKRLGILYRQYTTQVISQNSRSYSNDVKFPEARKVDPTVEEKCLQEKCKNLKNPSTGSDLCPLTPECDTPELRAKYCKKPYPNTYTCGQEKPSEGGRCVVNINASKSSTTCSKVKGCGE